MSRYARQLKLIGEKGQNRLADARVLIVGAGALTAAAMPYLAGAGVGRLRLVDPDLIEASNLHRQTLFRMQDLGKPKAQISADALRNLNDQCEIEPIIARLDPSNVEVLSEGCNLILDCADSFAASYTLSDHAYQAKIPLISASVLGRSGYAGGFCGGAPSMRAVFPDLPRRAGSCATDGVLGPVVGIIGAMQAEMALAHLAGLRPSPLGRIVSYDAANHRLGGFGFANAPEPDHRPRFIAATDLRPEDLLIDLRAPEEGPPLRDSLIRMTVDDIGPGLPEADRAVMCCKSGLRAWAAAERLRPHWSGEIVLVATG
ncbi:HesA/MoeB/ThiF family protein [Paracoccus caeni]|uniref:HesA/MoeB/ThiF family protein n=1 Tax=Paracoccus caeni TaxID=657651 RepID=A0A934W0W2_9RHOB|nr:HesA/MoeB/ThiF family protein [Paracoccus caeni]MBK4217365.1 HesA/MoeB/ThiF family protein [Paracoccus caeni]